MRSRRNSAAWREYVGVGNLPLLNEEVGGFLLRGKLPELVASNAYHGIRAVCQTGPQRVSGRKEQGQAGNHSGPPVGPRRRPAARSDGRARVSGRVPGRFRPHHDVAPPQPSAARLREASEMGQVAGPAPAAISVRGGRTLVDSTPWVRTSDTYATFKPYPAVRRQAFLHTKR